MCTGSSRWPQHTSRMRGLPQPRSVQHRCARSSELEATPLREQRADLLGVLVIMVYQPAHDVAR